MRLPIVLVLYAISVTPLLANGQAKSDTTAAISGAPEQSYRVTFLVRELVGGKPTGTRAYSSLLTDTREGESIRAGSRVPISLGAQAEPQYLDIGANFDFRISYPERGQLLSKNQLSLAIGAAVSSIATEGAATPVIRENKWRSTCLIELGKPTVIFSSEDPTVDRTTQVELTVIKLP